MRGHEVRRPLAGDQAQVMERAATELGKLGYEIKSSEGAKLQAKHAGKVFTADPEKMRHFLDVSVEGEELRFHFHTGLMASTWTDADRKWAEDRVDRLLGGQ